VRTCKAATASRKDRPRCRKAATQPRPHRPDGKLARCHVHGLIKPDWDQDIDADWTRRDPPSVIDSDSEDESDVASEDEDGDVADSGHGSTGLIQRYSRSTSRTGSMSSRHRSITPSRATRAGSGDEPVGSSSSSSSSSGLSARSRRHVAQGVDVVATVDNSASLDPKRVVSHTASRFPWSFGIRGRAPVPAIASRVVR
jgi:hypothetical protein